jgi:hypothetical protein
MMLLVMMIFFISAGVHLRLESGGRRVITMGINIAQESSADRKGFVLSREID